MVTAAYKDTPKFVKHPVRRGIEPLQMLLCSTRHLGESPFAKSLVRRLAKKGSTTLKSTLLDPRRRREGNVESD